MHHHRPDAPPPPKEPPPPENPPPPKPPPPPHPGVDQPPPIGMIQGMAPLPRRRDPNNTKKNSASSTAMKMSWPISSLPMGETACWLARRWKSAASPDSTWMI